MHHTLPIVLAIVSILWLPVTPSCVGKCQCPQPAQLYCHGLDKLPEVDEVPPNTEELIFDACDFDVLDHIPNYGPLIAHLMIMNGGIRDVKDGVFANMTNLQLLDLTGNKIRAVTNATFRGLTQLKELNLGRNLIRNLPDQVFQPLPSLTKLTLDGNRNITLGAHVFENSKLASLSIEYCGQNSSVFPIIRRAVSVTELDLDNNAFTSLPQGMLETLANLTKLYLARSNVSHVHLHAFDGLNKLERLDLSLNKIKNLPEDMVHYGLQNLQQLYIHDNNLTSLSAVFSVYKELKLKGNPWNCDCPIKWMKDFTFQPGDNVTCVTPESKKGQPVKNVTSSLFCPCGYSSCLTEERSRVALYIVIPILVLFSILIGYFVFKAIRKRKSKAGSKSVRYSSVYNETVETTSDKSPLHT